MSGKRSRLKFEGRCKITQISYLFFFCKFLLFSDTVLRIFSLGWFGIELCEIGLQSIYLYLICFCFLVNTKIRNLIPFNVRDRKNEPVGAPSLFFSFG